MSSDSDSFSSSSDSEVSDGDLEQNVFEAFKAVKDNLNKAGLKGKSNSSVQSKGKNTSASRHRLIYDTFINEETGSVKKNSTKSSSPSNKNSFEGNEGNSFMNFCIDKTSSYVKNTDGNTEDFVVVAYDLTNLNKTVSSQENLEETVTYDLSNTLNDSDTEDQDIKNDEDNGIHTDLKTNKELNAKKKVKSKKKKGVLSSKLEVDVALADVYVDVNPLVKSKSDKKEKKVKQKHAEPEIMKKCVISDDYEKQDTIQTTHVSVRQQKKERRLEREKTKGSKWFNMPATELTEERKYDLAVLQMRKALDPKRFYKAHDLKAAPKYFQFGEVVEDSSDFYSSRIPKKQRKSTVVEELLADAEFRKFNKRKYEEVQEAKRHGKGPYKHMKRLKKRKK